MVSMDLFGAQPWAAKVNGQKLAPPEAINAWRNEQSRWQQQFGTEIPDAERPAMQDGVLERLIRARLIGEPSQRRRGTG
jgi:hypothetical protein